MANQWLRLWHDMPTDPKWRTIARAAGQQISLVQAVYLHILVDASRNVTRGHATVTQEDLASALDVTEDAIASILGAMQGRVLDEMRLLGWEARQPKREDSGDESTGAKSAAQRQAEKRERDRISAEEQACHDESRNVTLDKDKEKNRKEYSVPKGTGAKAPMTSDEIIFGYGVPLLTGAGSTDKAARSFLGGLRKGHGDAAVVNVLRDCIREKPLQPLEWLAAALPPGGINAKPNAQEALEASNRSVAERFLAKDSHVAH